MKDCFKKILYNVYIVKKKFCIYKEYKFLITKYYYFVIIIIVIIFIIFIYSNSIIFEDEFNRIVFKVFDGEVFVVV